MDFPERLAQIRKEKGLTQQELAEKSGVSVIQIRRYETAAAQPTMELIRKLAITLGVSADLLVFDKEERGPDDELRLQFEAISKFLPEEKKIAKALLEGLILRHEAKRWATL
ncbi:MAG: helix-turn-helix transcriptional regulator [Candidatus Riflebacteria bacterium]|nr:helix-turn-helix transcriptional regulator [Candidatus Riflebacteria bacterium]